MKNKDVYILLFGIIANIFYSCSNTEKQLEVLKDISIVQLQKRDSFYLNLDSIYFEGINQVSLHNGYIYIAPMDLGLLLKLSPGKAIEYIEIPMEAESFYITEDRAFFNAYCTPLIDFKNEEDMKRIKFPREIDITTHLRYFVQDSIFYYFANSKNEEYTISMYNIPQKTVRHVGTLSSELDSKKFRFGSSRHLVSNGKNIYAVGKFVPIIEKYSYDGILEDQFDLRRIPVVSKWFDKKSLDKRLPYFVALDCCIDGDDLYLSVRDNKMNGIGQTIIRFNVKDEITFNSQYLLSDCKQMEHFTVKGDSIIAYNQKSKYINLYRVNK